MLKRLKRDRNVRLPRCKDKECLQAFLLEIKNAVVVSKS